MYVHSTTMHSLLKPMQLSYIVLHVVVKLGLLAICKLRALLTIHLWRLRDLDRGHD